MAANVGASLRRDVAAMLRRQDRAKLRALREQLRGVKNRKRGALAKVRGQCKAARARITEKWQAERRRVLSEIREAADRERVQARTVCERKKERVRRGAKQVELSASDRLREERRLQREIAEAYRKASRKLRLAKTTERRSESDDEVRRNIPEDLVPVFNKVKRQISGTPRKSRTEAFLQWVEENTAEVMAMEQDRADREIVRLIREEQKLARAMQSGRRYQRSAAAMAQDLADVPF